MKLLEVVRGARTAPEVLASVVALAKKIRKTAVVAGVCDGYGFPVHLGGPLHYASTLGLDTVLQAMQRLAGNPLNDAAFWQPAALLVRLAARGETFS